MGPIESYVRQGGKTGDDDDKGSPDYLRFLPLSDAPLFWPDGASVLVGHRGTPGLKGNVLMYGGL